VESGLTNYGGLHIEDICITGDTINTAGGVLRLDGTRIEDGDLVNRHGGMVKVEGLVELDEEEQVGGNVRNEGIVFVGPESALSVDHFFENNGDVTLLHGRCEAGDAFYNNITSSHIEGFGIISSEKVIENRGNIHAANGSLLLQSSGSVTNTGSLSNKALSSLHIKPAEDVNNFGTIEVNAGGGIAFDCNMVNEPNAVIKLFNGTLAAKTITQKAGAVFQGFGGITGNVVIEPNALVKLTGPTNIVGDVTIEEGATLDISDGTVLITGLTTCNGGTIKTFHGSIITQGGTLGICQTIIVN
jgi:hypothetical protein